MTTAVLNLAKAQRKVRQGIESIEIPSLNWKIFFITSFVVCSILLIFYALQVNNLTRGYFTINNYERQIEELTKENKDLQVSFAESSFWGQVSEKISQLNFKKVVSIKYIQIPDSAVATAIK